MPAKQHEMNERQKNIANLCDGKTPSRVIAEKLGENPKYVQHTMKRWNLPRIKQGGASAELNGAYKHGRRIDRDGYVLVSATKDHPYARARKDRPSKIMYEHRYIMEQKIGRYLLPHETVDHIDGLRLHNSPSNLRLFDSNKHHLQATIKGQIPRWSNEGFQNIGKKGVIPVDTYGKMKKSGDARLIQILLLALKLGIDSPFLLGTSHHLEKAGISDLSHSSLKRELGLLYQRYE